MWVQNSCKNLADDISKGEEKALYCKVKKQI